MICGDHLKLFRHRILASSALTHANMAVAGLENFLKVDVRRLTRNVFPQEAGPFQIDVSIFSPALVQQQPRSQGSLLRALRSERERDPGKRRSRGSRTKLILREESFVSHFFVWFIRNIHAVIATAR